MYNTAQYGILVSIAFSSHFLHNLYSSGIYYFVLVWINLFYDSACTMHVFTSQMHYLYEYTLNCLKVPQNVLMPAILKVLPPMSPYFVIPFSHMRAINSESSTICYPGMVLTLMYSDSTWMVSFSITGHIRIGNHNPQDL